MNTARPAKPVTVLIPAGEPERLLQNKRGPVVAHAVRGGDRSGDLELNIALKSLVAKG